MTIELKRLKIILIGPGEGGKTTLVKKLIEDTAIEREFKMTNGIKRIIWNITDNTEIEFWDFGGQEIYMNTHTLFYSLDAFYFIVFNSLMIDEILPIYDHILNLQCNVTNPKIILISTRTNKDRLEYKSFVNFINLLKNNTRCICYFGVDSLTGFNIENLRNYILQYVNDFGCINMDTNYFNLKNKLIQMRNVVDFSITKHEFNLLCEENNVNCNEAIDFFHDSQIIYNLSKDDEDCDIIIDPINLTNVLSCIITCHIKNKILCDSILEHKFLPHIFHNSNTNLHNQFLNFLHRKNLAFEIFDSEGNSTGSSFIYCLSQKNSSFLSSLELQRFENENKIRKEILNLYPELSKIKNCVVGISMITFETYLSNLTNILFTRLSLFGIKYKCSNNIFILSINNCNNEQSLCVIIVSKFNKGLIFCPIGCDYNASNIAIITLKNILDEIFKSIKLSNMCFSCIQGEIKYSLSEIIKGVNNTEYLYPLLNIEKSFCMKLYLLKKYSHITSFVLKKEDKYYIIYIEESFNPIVGYSLCKNSIKEIYNYNHHEDFSKVINNISKLFYLKNIDIPYGFTLIDYSTLERDYDLFTYTYDILGRKIYCSKEYLKLQRFENYMYILKNKNKIEKLKDKFIKEHTFEENYILQKNNIEELKYEIEYDIYLDRESFYLIFLNIKSRLLKCQDTDTFFKIVKFIFSEASDDDFLLNDFNTKFNLNKIENLDILVNFLDSNEIVYTNFNEFENKMETFEYIKNLQKNLKGNTFFNEFIFTLKKILLNETKLLIDFVDFILYSYIRNKITNDFNLVVTEEIENLICEITLNLDNINNIKKNLFVNFYLIEDNCFTFLCSECRKKLNKSYIISYETKRIIEKINDDKILLIANLDITDLIYLIHNLKNTEGWSNDIILKVKELYESIIYDNNHENEFLVYKLLNQFIQLNSKIEIQEITIDKEYIEKINFIFFLVETYNLSSNECDLKLKQVENNKVYVCDNCL